METIVIIGAGASGLACMNILNQTQRYNIIVLEQSNKPGRKILASGNGRCNVSNKEMSHHFYNTSSTLIKKIIEEFDIIAFFDDLSLKLRYEGNLIYPYSLSSLSVKNALLKNSKHISLIEQCEVLQIKHGKQYQLITSNGIYQADKVVVASGSPASLLSGQHNLDMLKKLKVKCAPFTPSLVQLKTKQ
ncbi:MAG: NAD(P)/FAD-dependent oxidoreductase, partial [Faecalibacillus sp.]